jgi:hypothetical protein
MKKEIEKTSCLFLAALSLLLCGCSLKVYKDFPSGNGSLGGGSGASETNSSSHIQGTQSSESNMPFAYQSEDYSYHVRNADGTSEERLTPANLTAPTLSLSGSGTAIVASPSKEVTAENDVASLLYRFDDKRFGEAEGGITEEYASKNQIPIEFVGWKKTDFSFEINLADFENKLDVVEEYRVVTIAEVPVGSGQITVLRSEATLYSKMGTAIKG